MVAYEINGSLYIKLCFRLIHIIIITFESDISRESYTNKYACGIRVGDFTIGDYWGVEKFHPEIERREEFLSYWSIVRSNVNR